MSLPAPDLDDRRFQELVDEAKRYVQQRCPEWSDHNVSDPGVTLIETFAHMVDQLLYRLNRVPDRLYVRFLDLIGLRLYPPTAARAGVTFWLSAPQPDAVVVPLGTEVATVRTGGEDIRTFTTTEDLPIVSCRLERTASILASAETHDHTDTLGVDATFLAFGQPPEPGDCLYLGLSDPAPSCVLLLHFDCTVEGVGVDPDNPPLLWEAWTGEDWQVCEVDRDGTGGLNRPGDLVLHLPRQHAASLVGHQRAGWVRCRITEAEEDQPRYSAPPRIHDVTVSTIGGTVTAVHAELIVDEVLGLSEGVSGQCFRLERTPVVPGEEPIVVEVAAGAGWQRWHQVDSFADSGPGDPHFVLDDSTGEIQLGPAVREPDGSLRRFGAVPPKGAPLRVPAYRTGGGQRGNVRQGMITALQSSIPYVDRVENRAPATGGVDAEGLEAAKVRGPVLLRTRNRAVTAEDYEHLAREAAPEIARVRCVPAGDELQSAGVRLLVVPAANDDAEGRLRFEQLLAPQETLERIGRYLDERRTVGARILIEPPAYQSITVIARLKARPQASPSVLQVAALQALYRYFHPLRGGPDGQGWPFGRPIQAGEIYAVLQGLTGTEYVQDARLYAADPVSGERGESVQRIDLDPQALVFSYRHQVLVEGA